MNPVASESYAAAVRPEEELRSSVGALPLQRPEEGVGPSRGALPLPCTTSAKVATGEAQERWSDQPFEEEELKSSHSVSSSSAACVSDSKKGEALGFKEDGGGSCEEVFEVTAERWWPTAGS
jgi:hypothetical protein